VTLPDALRAEVEASLGRVASVRPVGGGCISSSLRLELPAGPAFLKYDLQAPAGAFGVEAGGLRLLREASPDLRIPAVLAVHDPEEDGRPGWLALEWLEPAASSPGDGVRLGSGLAALHAAPSAGGWGLAHDGFLGPLPQRNGPAPDWPTFWRDRRLEPQLRRARDAGLSPGETRAWERLLASLPERLAPAAADGPSVLHGDLWSGNVLFTRAGPALVDPAAYRGHREVDLAMAELFGGLPAELLPAYRARFPLRPGYEVRRPVYQLYYLLVHDNLFGAGYVAPTVSTLRRALAAA
jgi:fructosamine-3-kinase